MEERRDLGAGPALPWIALVGLILAMVGCWAVGPNTDPGPGQPEPPPERVDGVGGVESGGDLDRRGDEHLRAGRAEQAIVAFDAWLKDHPDADPYHWRRGIAYYYAGRFREGARQFERHRTVNPDDVENAVWHFLCRAKLDGVEAARAGLLPVGPDRRVPMAAVYDMFAGSAGPADVERAARAPNLGPRQRASALFYAHLYLGLYRDALGQPEQARHHIGLAADEHYEPHYMGDIARVHAARLRKR